MNPSDTQHQPENPREPLAQGDTLTGYFTNINEIRSSEYPSLGTTTYLDHAGTTIYANSLIEAFSRDLTQNLFGNPHSASASSQLSTRRIDDVRLQVLRFFNADPDEFDVVFVANATAAVKLVADAFRDAEFGFSYNYHVDSHTSVVGARELAAQGSCCCSDAVMEHLLQQDTHSSLDRDGLHLIAYPGQSNMTGKRSSLDWSRRIRALRKDGQIRVYCLFDAASLVTTSALDLSNAAIAPDFIAISFYKIFGFPDLGALLVRKDAGEILRSRKFFGGGTVEMVATSGNVWHMKKEISLHDQLEDGTLPFHNILALRSAFEIHAKLYGSMNNITRHTSFLATQLRRLLNELKHANGRRTCDLYGSSGQQNSNYGPLIAFNLMDSSGNFVSNAEVEKLAVIKGIQFRTGGLCNPGGIAAHLGISTNDLRRNYNAGQRCGDGNDVINGRPTGTIRASLGAMSSIEDVESLIKFITEFYVDKDDAKGEIEVLRRGHSHSRNPKFVVESLSVFPIKSCAAFKIPSNISWEVGGKGLAYDREWCLVHEGTLVALNQKRYPRMALLRPSIDIEQRLLRVTHNIHGSGDCHLSINLEDSSLRNCLFGTCEAVTSRRSSVCGEKLDIEQYTAPEVARFFTDALGVPCTLARFPKNGKLRQVKVRGPGLTEDSATNIGGRCIALSNESPILLISRSSVNHLNEQIKENGGVGKAVAADSFRGNIVIAEELTGGQAESPYIEDSWTNLRIGSDATNEFEVLGPCQRCQMVCVDQKSAQRRQEPFSTLAKTRRKGGRVWFGMHLCLRNCNDERGRLIRIGDTVQGSGNTNT